MTISKLGNPFGKFKYNSKKPLEIEIAVVIPISDDPKRSETEKYWAVPKNDNARAIMGCLPFAQKLPKELQERFGEKFGWLSDGIRDENLDVPEMIKRSQETLAGLIAGEKENWKKEGFEINFGEPTVVDERKPNTPFHERK